MRQQIDYLKQSMIPGGPITTYTVLVVINANGARHGVQIDVLRVNTCMTSGINA